LVIQPREQLNNRRFALAVLSDQSQTFATLKWKLTSLSTSRVCAWIRERNVAELKSLQIGRGTESAFGFEDTVGFIAKKSSRSVTKSALIRNG